MSGADKAATRIGDLVASGNWNTDQLAAIIRAEVSNDYPIPGPYEIALQVGAALAATGRYETPGAALYAAWGAVPEFFSGRNFYLTQIVPALYGQAVAPAAEEPASQEFQA